MHFRIVKEVLQIFVMKSKYWDLIGLKTSLEENKALLFRLDPEQC